MKQISVFKCEKCGQKHRTMERARKCENSHRTIKSFGISDEKHEFLAFTTGFPRYIKVNDYEDGKGVIYKLEEDYDVKDWDFIL